MRPDSPRRTTSGVPGIQEKPKPQTSGTSPADVRLLSFHPPLTEASYGFQQGMTLGSSAWAGPLPFDPHSALPPDFDDHDPDEEQATDAQRRAVCSSDEDYRSMNDSDLGREMLDALVFATRRSTDQAPRRARMPKGAAQTMIQHTVRALGLVWYLLHRDARSLSATDRFTLRFLMRDRHYLEDYLLSQQALKSLNPLYSQKGLIQALDQVQRRIVAINYPANLPEILAKTGMNGGCEARLADLAKLEAACEAGGDIDDHPLRFTCLDETIDLARHLSMGTAPLVFSEARDAIYKAAFLDLVTLIKGPVHDRPSDPEPIALERLAQGLRRGAAKVGVDPTPPVNIDALTRAEQQSLVQFHDDQAAMKGTLVRLQTRKKILMAGVPPEPSRELTEGAQELRELGYVPGKLDASLRKVEEWCALLRRDGKFENPEEFRRVLGDCRNAGVDLTSVTAQRDDEGKLLVLLVALKGHINECADLNYGSHNPVRYLLGTDKVVARLAVMQAAKNRAAANAEAESEEGMGAQGVPATPVAGDAGHVRALDGWKVVQDRFQPPQKPGWEGATNEGTESSHSIWKASKDGMEVQMSRPQMRLINQLDRRLVVERQQLEDAIAGLRDQQGMPVDLQDELSGMEGVEGVFEGLGVRLHRIGGGAQFMLRQIDLSKQ